MMLSNEESECCSRPPIIMTPSATKNGQRVFMLLFLLEVKFLESCDNSMGKYWPTTAFIETLNAFKISCDCNGPESL